MRRKIALLCAVAALAAPATAGETFRLEPQNANNGCDERFENRANELKPGDELVLATGVYTQSCRRAITVNGTPDAWITIRAEDGADVELTRPVANRTTQNNLEVVESSYLVIRGIRFRGGSIGVRFIGGHDIVFEDNEVLETGSSGVTLNSGDTYRTRFYRNEVHHTGLARGDAPGEGFYVGCNNAECVSHDGIYEGNHVHHTRSTHDGGNDGIEIKFGSGGNVVRGNLIHDTNIGKAFPCVFAYGGAEVNVIESNVLYRCGEAIQVAADAIVRNNVVFDASIHGITAARHEQVGHPRNLVIVNNTFADSKVCASLYLVSGEDIVFANNVMSCPETVAVRARGLVFAENASNFTIGETRGIDSRREGFTRLDTAGFVDAAGRDFRLSAGSPLIDSGTAEVPELATYDAEGVPRRYGDSVDAGAFEYLPAHIVDLDGDGLIGPGDWQRLRTGYLLGSDEGDLSGDGRTDATDLRIFRVTHERQHPQRPRSDD